MTDEERTLRAKIDALDDGIINLLHERASVSGQIQRSRIRSGGARVDLSRESRVIATYTMILGEAGKDVAATVLDFCRGRRDAVPSEPEGQALLGSAQ